MHLLFHEQVEAHNYTVQQPQYVVALGMDSGTTGG